MNHLSRILIPTAAVLALSSAALAYSAANRQPETLSISNGMEYSEARQAAEDADFRAGSVPPAGGYAEDDDKVVQECSTVEVCNAYPEILHCSGAGACKMVFVRGKQQLIINTFGELADGESPENARVTSWEIK